MKVMKVKKVTSRRTKSVPIRRPKCVLISRSVFRSEGQIQFRSEGQSQFRLERQNQFRSEGQSQFRSEGRDLSLRTWLVRRNWSWDCSFGFSFSKSGGFFHRSSVHFLALEVIISFGFPLQRSHWVERFFTNCRALFQRSPCG